MLLHNSHDIRFRCPLGPVPAGNNVTLRFQADEAAAVILRTWNDREHLAWPMIFDGKDSWSAVVTMPDIPGLNWYSFEVIRRDGVSLRYGNAYDQLGGEGAVYEKGDVLGYQLTVYDPAYETPDYLQGANIYQIFPDRLFRAKTSAKDDRKDRYIHKKWNEDLLTDSDPRSGDHMALDFFGGTLNGIREKLPYLSELGVTVLYLNPIFRARSNHRYDTGDYTLIDPLLGTNEEFTELCAAAEQAGIRVILDGVFSHTGEDSRYFNHFGHYATVGASQSKDSPWFSWYTFEHWPDKYRCWWGIPSLPECDKHDPTYREFIMKEGSGIVPRWLEAGASGWRLDVADELPMDFLRQLRRSARRAKPDAAIIGEVWEDASNKVAYGQMRCYCTGDTLDSVMNYPLREAILSFLTRQSTAEDLAKLIRHQEEVYPAPFRYALMNLIGSHDRARAINILAGKEGKDLSVADRAKVTLTEEEYMLGAERYRLAVDILCALPGCPTIYYGDEAGLTGTPDPFCRKPYPWGREDAALRAYVGRKLNGRLASAALKTGFCSVFAPNDDTIVITRWTDDRDALGRPARPDRAVITIRR